MEEFKQEEETVEEEYRPKTEEEKAKEIKYNSDGERLVYIGNDCWVPEKAIPTEQDLHEYYARFARPRIYPLSIIWNILIPLILSAGMLSPVSADSSTAVDPSVMMPSTGMLSPGRTAKISPFCT